MPVRLLLSSTALLLAVATTSADARAGDEASALARRGTAAIESQRFGDALDAFTRAAAMQPRDAGLCFGAGVAAFMLGQDEVAQTRLECALALDPGHLPAAVWLGDLHYRAGRLHEAIAIYETARTGSPDRRDLEDQLATWRRERELQGRFHEVRSEHFAALFEADSDAPFARDVLARLETSYRRVGALLGVYPSRAITVVLYTREQFSDVTRLADWSVAAYDGRIRVPLGDGLRDPAELDRVLSHEFVHALVAAVGGRTVPAWLNEGLATVLEPAGTQDAGATLDRSEPQPALSRLHRSFVSLSRRDAESAYASAARAVGRLIDQHGASAVVALLEDLARGRPFATAFQQRLAIRYERFAEGMARGDER